MPVFVLPKFPGTNWFGVEPPLYERTIVISRPPLLGTTRSVLTIFRMPVKGSMDSAPILLSGARNDDCPGSRLELRRASFYEK